MSKSVHNPKLHTTASLMVLYVMLVAFAALMAAIIPLDGNFASALRLATTHQPETFTELYFVNPGHLPGFAAPGKKQTVSFRIQSHAARRQAYPYRVTVTGPDGTKTANGSVTLSPGAGATIPFSFTIAEANQKVAITVSLVGTQQHLTLRSRS